MKPRDHPGVVQRMRIPTRIVLLAAVVVVVVAGGAFWYFKLREAPIVKKPKAEVVADIDGYLTQLVGKDFAGQLLLVQDGAVLLDKGYGDADRAAHRPVTPDTAFDIGSLVKPFTMMAILKLESDGKLRRADSIARFFPGVPADKASITIQQLLTHSSGLPDIVDASSKPLGYAPDFDYEPVSRDEIVRRALHATLLYAPGARSKYSNLGYSLLGAIVEIASGQPYERFVHDRIFVPAGMSRTGYVIPPWPQLAVGYQGTKPWGTPLDHRWLADGPSWNLRANGGMLSSARELHRWIAALDGGALLTPAEKQVFFDLAVHRNKRGARTMGVAGGNDIFNACYLWYPDEHRLVILLTNGDRWRAEDIVPDLAKRMRSIA